MKRKLSLAAILLVQGYLEFQASGPNYHLGLTSPKKVKDLRDIQLAWVNPDQEGFVENIDVNLVFGRNYATSFIVQKLRVPPNRTHRGE